MASNPCADAVVAKYGAKLSPDATQIFEREFADVIRAKNVESAFEHKDRVVLQKRMDAARNYRNAVLNKEKLQTKMDALQANWSHDVAEGMRSSAVGGHMGQPDAAKGLAQDVHAAAQYQMVQFQARLNEAGFEVAALAKRLHADPEFEVRILENRAALAEGKPMPHAGEEATLGRLFHENGKQAMEYLQAHGGEIGDLGADFIMSHSWDADKINRAGDVINDRWISTVNPTRLTDDQHMNAWVAENRKAMGEKGEKRTFKEFYHLKEVNPKAYGRRANEFMQAAWRGMATGLHLSTAGHDGPSMLPKGADWARFAKHRVLFYADARETARMNRLFGRGTLLDSHMHSIQQMYRTAELLRQWGPNARTNFQKYIEFGKSLAAHSPNSAEQSRRLVKTMRAIEHSFAVADGSADMPADLSIARLEQISNVAAMTTRLAMLPFAQTMDTVQSSSAMQRMTGEFGNTIKNLVDARVEMLGMPKDEVKAIAAAEGLGLETYLDEFLHHTGFNTGITGLATKFSRLWAKLNVVDRVNDVNRFADQIIVQSFLHGIRNKAFDALSKETKADFVRNGMDKDTWEIVRQFAKEKITSKNRSLMTQEGLDQVPLESFASHPSAEPKLEAVAQRHASELEKLGISGKNTSLKAQKALSAAGKHTTGFDPEITAVAAEHKSAIEKLKEDSAKAIADKQEALMAPVREAVAEQGVTSAKGADRIKRYLSAQDSLAKVDEKFGSDAVSLAMEAEDKIAEHVDEPGGKAAIDTIESNLNSDLEDAGLEELSDRTRVRNAVREAAAAEKAVGSEKGIDDTSPVREAMKKIRKMRTEEGKKLRKAIEAKTEETHNRIDELTPKEHDLGQTPSDEILDKATAALKKFEALITANATTAAKSEIRMSELADRALRATMQADKERTRILREVREDTQIRLRNYVRSKVFEGAMETDPRVKADLSKNQQRGTMSSFAWQQILRFKQFPLSVYNKHILTNLYSKGPYKQVYHPFNFAEHGKRLAAGNGEFSSTMHLVFESATMGAALLTIRSLLKGQVPAVPQSPSDATAFFMRALSMGGGLGIMGDLMASTLQTETQRSTLSFVGGPAGDLADSVRKMLVDVYQGKPVGSDAINTLIRNLPATFYTRALMDVYLASYLREWNNPGSQQRFEDRMRQNANVNYYLPYRAGVQ